MSKFTLFLSSFFVFCIVFTFPLLSLFAISVFVGYSARKTLRALFTAAKKPAVINVRRITR